MSDQRAHRTAQYEGLMVSAVTSLSRCHEGCEVGQIPTDSMLGGSIDAEGNPLTRVLFWPSALGA